MFIINGKRPKIIKIFVSFILRANIEEKTPGIFCSYMCFQMQHSKIQEKQKKDPDNLSKRSICPLKLRAAFSKKKTDVDRNIELKFPSNAAQLKKVNY